MKLKFLFFLDFLYYYKPIENLVKGHLDSVEIECDKQRAPSSLIELLL
jgi:hypothetical protein